MENSHKHELHDSALSLVKRFGLKSISIMDTIPGATDAELEILVHFFGIPLQNEKHEVVMPHKQGTNPDKNPEDNEGEENEEDTIE